MPYGSSTTAITLQSKPRSLPSPANKRRRNRELIRHRSKRSNTESLPARQKIDGEKEERILPKMYMHIELQAPLVTTSSKCMIYFFAIGTQKYESVENGATKYRKFHFVERLRDLVSPPAKSTGSKEISLTHHSRGDVLADSYTFS